MELYVGISSFHNCNLVCAACISFTTPATPLTTKPEPPACWALKLWVKQKQRWRGKRPQFQVQRYVNFDASSSMLFSLHTHLYLIIIENILINFVSKYINTQICVYVALSIAASFFLIYFLWGYLHDHIVNHM